MLDLKLTHIHFMLYFFDYLIKMLNIFTSKN